jgi:hypothetical protein
MVYCWLWKSLNWKIFSMRPVLLLTACSTRCSNFRLCRFWTQTSTSHHIITLWCLHSVACRYAGYCLLSWFIILFMPEECAISWCRIKKDKLIKHFTSSLYQCLGCWYWYCLNQVLYLVQNSDMEHTVKSIFCHHYFEQVFLLMEIPSAHQFTLLSSQKNSSTGACFNNHTKW